MSNQSNQDPNKNQWAKGLDNKLTSNQSNVCPTCKGTGAVVSDIGGSPCYTCGGTGRKSEPFDHWVGEDGSTNLEYKSKSEPTIADAEGGVAAVLDLYKTGPVKEVYDAWLEQEKKDKRHWVDVESEPAKQDYKWVVVLFAPEDDSPSCELNRCVREAEIFDTKEEAKVYMDENREYLPHRIIVNTTPESDPARGHCCGDGPCNSPADPTPVTALEEAMQKMEGKQMPLLINGENWWPERYITERVVAELESLYKVVEDETSSKWAYRTMEQIGERIKALKGAIEQ